MATIIGDHREETVNQEAFRARMKAQCGQIDKYRLTVLRNEGRRLSLNEAAMEWIERYAEAFANGTH